MRKRFFSLVLTALMLLSMVPMTANGASVEPQKETYSGTCGANAMWTLNTDSGQLMISGTGAIYDTYSGGPWYNYRSLIKNVIIMDDINSIGQFSFFNCEILNNVNISNSVTEIHSYAFFSCSLLQRITIPDQVKSIGSFAFASCAINTISLPKSIISIDQGAFQNCPVSDIYYSGSESDWNKIKIGGNNMELRNARIHFVEHISIPDDSTPFDLKADGYSFCNAYEGFNYSSIPKYKTPLSIYQDVYGTKYTQQMYKTEKSWDGNCYGMATTSILFNEGKLNPLNYTNASNYVNVNSSLFSGITKKSGGLYYYINNNTELTRLIERYSVWQYSDEAHSLSKQNVYFFQDDINNIFAEQGGTVRFLLENFDNYRVDLSWSEAGHALVIDSSRKPDYIGDGWYKIYLYDPNNPFFPNGKGKRIRNYYGKATERYLLMNIETNQWKIDVSVTTGSKIRRVGYDDEGNYIDNSMIRILDIKELPTNFDGSCNYYRNNGIVLMNLKYENNVIILDENQNIVAKIFNYDVNLSPLISQVFKNSENIEKPMFDLVLPYGNYIIQFEDDNIIQVQNRNYLSGIIADSGTTIELNTDGTVKVNGDENSTVDLVVEKINEDTDEFTSVNMVIENDGENDTTVSLDEENHLDVVSKDDNISVNVIANGFDNEFALNDVAVSDIGNENIVEYALENGKLVPNEIENATVETYNGIFDGNEHNAIKLINYLGKEMTEGVDYELSGDVTATEIGQYSVTVIGIGTYTGSIELSYNILPQLNTPELSLDINETVTVTANVLKNTDCDNYGVNLIYGENTISNEEYSEDGNHLIFTFENIELLDCVTEFSAIAYSMYDDLMITSEQTTVTPGHEYIPTVTDANCTEQGYTIYICSRCGDNYVDNYTDPLGHDFSDWQDHPDDETLEIRYCSRCDAYETRDKEPVIIGDIAIEKLTAYDVKLTGLDPTLSYVIRYATGEYATASAVKKGLNAGFVQVSGVSEAVITLPTHGLHTIAATVGSEQKFIGTVSIDVEDMMKEVEIYIDDLNLRVLNLYGATRVNLLDRYGNIIMKINPSSFMTDGLKTWADVELPASDHYVLRVMFGNEYIETPFDAVVPAANISTNGRIFTLANYGAGNVSYIRFAKGVITTAAEMKAAEDLRIFGRKYFTGDTASFAALDAVNGETTTYTVQIGYNSGYSEFITFEITPTVPVFNTTSDSITLTNVQTADYYIDWVRCAPGVQTSLYGVRHANGSQVKKTADIVNGRIAFTGLPAGKYTLYYLYDGWNLSEGMVTVTVN